MANLRPFYIFKILLLFVICHNVKYATATSTSTLCGRDPDSVLSIRNDLAIAFCSDRIIRVVRDENHNNAFSKMTNRESLVIDPASSTSHPFTDFETETNDKGDIVSLSTRAVLIHVDYGDDDDDDDDKALLSFFDETGNYLFTHEVAETENSRKEGTRTIIQQSWSVFPDESLYGGGQLVNGFLDYKAAPLHLVHTNLEVAMPFFVSSRGYGILWDNYGETWLNPPNKLNQIHLKPSSFVERKGDGESHLAKGIFTPSQSGDYWFSVDMQEEPGYWNSNKLVILELVSHNNNNLEKITACHINEENIPKVLTCKASNLRRAIPYEVSLKYDSDVLPLVLYTFIDGHNRTTIETKDDEFIDYYLMVAANEQDQKVSNVIRDENYKARKDEVDHAYSSKIDSIIASYRKLTGPASLFTKKAYGFWQCKEHYHNQSEILVSANKFREMEIPVDNIVQDWLYWGSLGWGPHWDRSLYPNPEDMIQQLHADYDLDFMVSVWSRFDKQTSFYTEMLSKGFLINGTEYFDPWNPMARKLFFQYLDDALFSIGADAVWLDATEPEQDFQLNKSIYLGAGNEYRNTYSLEVSRAFYEGFVGKYKTRKRPFALTRSSFLGQHRFASVVWSGDTLASFECLKRQIAMSINYQMSGDPRWTMDIGGFFRPGDQYSSEEYHLLLLRWFQFGVFVPIFRLHGGGTNTELWNFGNETQSLIVESAINLRYRLIPYIYSGFQRVQDHGYTMGRAMAFDFLHDKFARNISDQFMFGESFLVAPVYNLESNRTFYLPPLKKTCCSNAKSMWRDFYSGQVVKPGRYFASKVDFASTLLFVRSSIVVLAPKSQHVHDPASLASLEVRVYTGKNSIFTLFEDDGIDPSPSRPSTKIVFSWSEKNSQLRIGKLQGKKYPGMPSSRVVRVVLVRHGRGIGVDETKQPDATVTYYGQELNIDLSTILPELMTKENFNNLYLPAGSFMKVATS